MAALAGNWSKLSPLLSPLNPLNPGKGSPEQRWPRSKRCPCLAEGTQPRGRLIAAGQSLLTHSGSPGLITGSQSSATHQLSPVCPMPEPGLIPRASQCLELSADPPTPLQGLELQSQTLWSCSPEPPGAAIPKPLSPSCSSETVPSGTPQKSRASRATQGHSRWPRSF